MLKIKLVQNRITLCAICFLFLFPFHSFSQTSIGIKAFVNKRLKLEHNWLNQALSDRLRSNLSKISTIKLLSSPHMRMNAFLQKNDPPPKDIAIISGEFHILNNNTSVRITWQKNETKKEFQATGEYSDFNFLIDSLAQQIAQELGFSLPLLPIKFPDLQSEYTQIFYGSQYKRLYLPESYNFEDLYALSPIFEITKFPYLLEELIVSLIIHASSLSLEKKNALLSEGISYIRTAIKEFSTPPPKLYGLLAELYYWRGHRHDFMEQFARLHLRFDSYDEISHLIMALSLGPSTGEGKEQIQFMNNSNPYIYDSRLPISLSLRQGILQAILKEFQPKERKQSQPVRPATFSSFYAQAQNHIKKGENEDAQVILLSILEKKPNEKKARLLLFKIYKQTKPILDQLEFLLVSLKYLPRSDEIRLQTAQTYAGLNRLDLAKKHFQLIPKQNQLLLPAIQRFVTLLIRNSKTKEAQELLDEMLIVHPENGLFWYQKGLIAWQNKKWTEALQDWEKAQTLNPDNESINAMLKKARQKMEL